MGRSDNKTIGWADQPGTRRKIRYVLYAVCIILVITDFLVHRHTVIALEKISAFYAIYGFAALITVVLLAKGLRRLVKREETYYEHNNDDTA